MPKGLAPQGRRLWREIAGGFELRPDEYRVLEDACREADLIDRLQDELTGAPLQVEGYKGQPVASPLVSELRQHRTVLARLLAGLKLPDQDAQASAPLSTSARHAAIEKWGRRVS